jgi:hypothetical protein
VKEMSQVTGARTSHFRESWPTPLEAAFETKQFELLKQGLRHPPTVSKILSPEQRIPHEGREAGFIARAV